MRHSCFTRIRAFACLMALSLLSGCLSPDISAMTESVPGMNLLMPQADGQPTPVSFFEASTRPMRGVKGVHYSLDIVSIPPNHRVGRIETPVLGKPDPQSDFALTLDRPLSERKFGDGVATYLSGRVGSNRDILVFVHGFNTSEREAQFRLAQIVMDGRFGGVPVLFTWPANGGPLSYIAQKDRAMTSRDALEGLLMQLSQTPGLGRIHIVAHSMGSWIAMEALRDLAIAGHPELGGKLGQILLAAPDIDINVFREQLSKLRNPGEVSIFISANDRALSLSSSIHGDGFRLGDANLKDPKQRAEIESLGVHVYDLSRYWDGFIGHDAFAELPRAVRAIGAKITAPRKSDYDATAVIDLGVDRTPSPAPPSADSGAGAIQVSPLTNLGDTATPAAPVSHAGSDAPAGATANR